MDDASCQTRCLTASERLRWTHVGMLAALALLLGYAETFVPIPLPGVKLGLANIPVLVALATGDLVGAACIACIKVLAIGLLFGSPLTMVYGAVGTTFAFVGMAPLSGLPTMRLWMVSVVGAVLHEIGQLVVASVLLGTTAVWYAAPLLLVAGCVTGILCGILASGLVESLPRGGTLRTPEVAPPTPRRPKPRVLVALVALVAFVLVVLHARDLATLGVCMALALACAGVAHVTYRMLLGTLRPLVAFLAITLVIQLVLNPEDAILEATRGSLRLASIACASVAFMQLVPEDDACSTVAWLARPVSGIGVRTEGFVLATCVAIRLVPVLADIVHDEMSGHDHSLSLRSLGEVLPRIARKLWQKMEQGI